MTKNRVKLYTKGGRLKSSFNCNGDWTEDRIAAAHAQHLKVGTIIKVNNTRYKVTGAGGLKGIVTC